MAALHQPRHSENHSKRPRGSFQVLRCLLGKEFRATSLLPWQSLAPYQAALPRLSPGAEVWGSPSPALP